MKILVLAKSGFGKTTSWSGREKLGIKGLNPKDTYVIQCIGRAVANVNFKLAPGIEPKELAEGRRVAMDNVPVDVRFEAVAKLIRSLSKSSSIKNIVVDDMNFLIQDHYMSNATRRKGYAEYDELGAGMALVFSAIKTVPEDKNIICLGHYQEFKDKNGDSISYKFKTIGKMVDDYITPEANFDIVLFGKSSYSESEKKAQKVFVKEFDGEFPAKDAVGALDSLPDEFPNDLSIVVEEIDKFYGKTTDKTEETK